jgi:hypothetical protein
MKRGLFLKKPYLKAQFVKKDEHKTFCFLSSLLLRPHFPQVEKLHHGVEMFCVSLHFMGSEDGCFACVEVSVIFLLILLDCMLCN